MGIVALTFAAIFAASTGLQFVTLFAALGGLSGLAALATVFVNYKANKNKAVVEDKSVAIVELEKAVPGMADIIKEWQNIVQQLHSDLSNTRKELEECNKRVSELEGRSP